MLDLKFLVPVAAEGFVVSPDKKKLLTVTGCKLEIRNVSSFEVLIYVKDSSFEHLNFSPNSNYISFINEKTNLLKIYEIETENLLEINLKSFISIKCLIWNSSSEILLYLSELEIFIGVYDMKFHSNFTLRGCSFSDTNEPLCTFSPNDDYLCFHKLNFCYVYCCKTWDLMSEINCEVNALNLKFVAPYVIFITNNHGLVSGYSILSKQKVHSENYLPNECIKNFDVSTNGLIVAMGSYSNFLVLRETVSFKKISRLYYKFKISNKDGIDVWEEQKNEERMVKKWIINNNNPIQINQIKNINDEFKVKTNVKFLISFSADNIYIASYHPGIKDTIWVWNWAEESPLRVVIILQETKICALKWHDKLNLLAVVCSDKLILWFENDYCTVINCTKVNFNWASKRETVGVIGNDSLVQMLIIQK